MCCFGSLCDSGNTHSMGFQEIFIEIMKSLIFLFRNKLILILILILKQRIYFNKAPVEWKN